MGLVFPRTSVGAVRPSLAAGGRGLCLSSVCGSTNQGNSVEMPHTKSAMKRLRSSAKRRLGNRIRKSRIHTSERRLMEKIDAKDPAGVQVALNKCFSELDKAAKVGSIHKNRADRKKQRLAARVKTLAAVPAEVK